MIEEIQEKVPTEIEFKEMIERMKIYAYQKDSDYLIPILGEKQAKKMQNFKQTRLDSYFK